MARISLDPLNPLTRALRLDDDPNVADLPGQIPKITLLERKAIGRNDAGLRVFDWVPIAEGLLVVTSEQRTLETADVRKLEVKLVALWDKSQVLDGTELAFDMDSNAGEDSVYRVKSFEQNGFRLSLVGERHF